MKQTKYRAHSLLFVLLGMLLPFFLPQNVYGQIEHNVAAKTITISDNSRDLIIRINYSQGCKIDELSIKGENTLSASGVYTAIKTFEQDFCTSINADEVKVAKTKDGIVLSNITYGNNSVGASESWEFVVVDNRIRWTISRTYNNSAMLDETAFPQWNFANLSVWKGGILDNGGMVWCKYLGVNDTYGVHTGGVTFWNPESGNAFRVVPIVAPNDYIAAKYSQSEKGEFTCTHFLAESEPKQRYNLNRFVSKQTDVFAPFNIQKGNVKLSFDLEYVNYHKEYSRGTLPGIDANAVRELLNTTGRYGVVDNNIVGANGWITNWKCLHEPFFAQIGLALNDENYTKNMSSTLDQERDLAMLENGRVLSRWHNAAGDEIPGTFNAKTGYYEAMWGYTIDSQTGYVINTAEQFDICGDVNWLHAHKESCEKALDWLIKRDTNNNGIFEMMNNDISEKKASDWLDIVWAGFENAFVNAQMYNALSQWANCELILGDKVKSEYYQMVATRLKDAFNRSIDEGGFWYPEKSQYVYWRDKDGSIHGDNIVTPVNFAAIAFGICDDKGRIKQVLDQIEQRTVAENLFHWPLCFDSYREDEVHGNNWPFPKYENGDIFPTWGYLGVRAYVDYDKSSALRYIRNILTQYNKDGLSSQRYSRETQQGLGSDILAGICTSITALYRDIYGIRPKWNRMGLEPNMSDILNGTSFSYILRDVTYDLSISVDDYKMETNNFSLRSKDSFGANHENNTLIYYPFNKEDMTLSITSSSPQKPIEMEIEEWNSVTYSWKITSADNYMIEIKGLSANAKYKLLVDDKYIDVNLKADGSMLIKYKTKGATIFKLSEA